MTASVDQVRPREYERRQLPIFPNYTQVPRRVSVSRWRWIRLSVFVAGLIEIGLLVSGQPVGLKLFFGAVVPVLPLLWFVAPGVWRNLCPLAAANQTPRLFGFSRAKKAPPWLAEHGFLIAATTLLALIPARKFLLEESGPALGALLLVLLVLAFVGGIFFQGKSGWCSTVCPLLPVQRLYGQQPLLDSPNSHCEPCVGCAKNCNDFNPHLAFLADQHDGDRTWMLRRRLFAALFPGFIAGYFLVQSPPEISIAQMYGQILLAACLSAGVFFVLDAVLMVPPGTLTALSAAVSINLYYWWTSERALLMWGVDSELAAWTLRAVVLALSAAFLVRFVVKEKAYVETIGAPQTSRSETTASGAVAAALRAAGSLEELVVIDRHGAETRVKTVSNKSVLDAVEGAGIQIESGCRMGVCGADPIAVLDGAESLSPPSADEKQTLRRLGLGPSARLACMSRVSGSCTISLNPELSAVEGDSTPEFVVDAEVRRVVVVGNGVAGVTAADYVRRFHPDCTIDLISREPHHLYNRMGISKLIYGRTAMEGLYLQPDRWYSDNKITTWLNTEAQRINPATRSVELGTGDVVGYDRLILATGSQSFVPPVPGFDRPGVFVCREAADATAIRRYAQGARARSAVVAGGGLLGIEAAYALYKLNVRVTVLERGPYLLWSATR